MLHNIQAVTLSNGRVPDLTREPRASPTVAQLVNTTEVPPAALRAALKLAGGDTSRLTFNTDGTVMVNNRPRPARRTQEPPR